MRPERFSAFVLAGALAVAAATVLVATRGEDVATAAALPAGARRPLPPSAQRTLMLRGGTAAEPLRFLLSLPSGYEEGTGLWPMILYLHGRSRRGNDLATLRQFSLPAVVDRRDIPFIVVSPQCPDGKSWLDVTGFDSLLDTLVKTWRIDPARIYLTGHSMGGSGVWYVAQKYPHRFAAIAPVAGGQVPLAWAARLGDTPVFILHGDEDDLTPIRYAREIAGALEKAGHAPQFRVFPGEGHDILHVYEEPEIYDFFRAHSLAGAQHAAPAEVVDPRP